MSTIFSFDVDPLFSDLEWLGALLSPALLTLAIFCFCKPIIDECISTAEKKQQLTNTVHWAIAGVVSVFGAEIISMAALRVLVERDAFRLALILRVLPTTLVFVIQAIWIPLLLIGIQALSIRLSRGEAVGRSVARLKGHIEKMTYIRLPLTAGWFLVAIALSVALTSLALAGPLSTLGKIQHEMDLHGGPPVLSSATHQH